MRISIKQILRENYKENDRKTYTAVAEKRKKEMDESSTKLFGNIAIGIHIKELPKFLNSENKQYWTIKSGYNPHVKIQSQRELVASAKYWAKPDALFLNDFKAHPSKTAASIYIPKSTKNSVVEKINNAEFVSNDDGLIRFNHNYGKGSWANQMSSRKELQSVYDVDPNQRESLKRYLESPMYSCFSANKEFPEYKTSSSL